VMQKNPSKLQVKRERMAVGTTQGESRGGQAEP
jgi:hypothetical protein